jgi:hypothetical protein
MDDLPEQVTLWRCACCGKWSSAKRRPTHHLRKLRELVDDYGEPFEECQTYADGDRTDGRTYSDPQVEAAYWELPTVEFEPGSWWTAVVTNVHGDPEPDEHYGPATVVVKCGPFVEYTAYLRAQWHKDDRAREHASALSAECMNEDPAVRRAVAPGGDLAF